MYSERGVQVTYEDVYGAVSNRKLAAFYSLLAGLHLSPAHAHHLAILTLCETGANTDQMAKAIFRGFNVQLQSGRLANIIEDWGDQGSSPEVNIHFAKIWNSLT